MQSYPETRRELQVAGRRIVWPVIRDGLVVRVLGSTKLSLAHMAAQAADSG